jgi:hypothetical protein
MTLLLNLLLANVGAVQSCPHHYCDLQYFDLVDREIVALSQLYQVLSDSQPAPFVLQLYVYIC